MSKVVYAHPGQNIILYFDLVDSTGVRTDSPTEPSITSIYNNNLDLIIKVSVLNNDDDMIIFNDLNEILVLTDYPVAMKHIDTGLYSFNIRLPKGPNAVGSYIISIIWTDPDTAKLRTDHYQIICKSYPNAAGEYIAGIPHL